MRRIGWRLWWLWRFSRLWRWQPPEGIRSQILVDPVTEEIGIILSTRSGRTSTVSTTGPMDGVLFNLLKIRADVLVWWESEGEAERDRQFERNFACVRRHKGGGVP
jgi:hypothetical protein